jgi:hypothetical protein
MKMIRRVDKCLTDFGIAHRAAFTCASMKAKACFEEATAGYGPLCIVTANAKAYAEAVVEEKRLLIGEREPTIVIHRRQVEQGFKNMVTSPLKLAEHWVLIQESLEALEELAAPISKMDQRDRLLQVCDQIKALHAVRARTILDSGCKMEPTELLYVMKEFVVLTLEPEHAPASSVVRHDFQHKYSAQSQDTSQQIQMQCHRCAQKFIKREIWAAQERLRMCTV